MKRIGLVLFVVLFSSSVFSQKYVYSCESVDGTEYYVYSDIVKTENFGIYQVWVKMGYKGESKNNAIKFIKKYRNDGITDEQIESSFYSENVYLIDVNRNRSKLLKSSFWNLSGDVLESYSNNENETSWDYIRPESVLDSVLKTVKSLLKNKKWKN